MSSVLRSNLLFRLLVVLLLATWVGLLVMSFYAQREVSSFAVWQVVLLSGVVAGLITSLVGLIINRWVLEPLTAMRTAADLSSNTSVIQPVPIMGDGELAELGQALNHMSSRLQEKVSDLDKEKGKVTAILESMVESVIALDDHGRVALINPAGCHTFGLLQEQTIGKSLIEVIRNKGLSDLAEASRMSNGSGLLRGEVEIAPPINRVLEAHAIPLSSEANRTGTLLVFHDITELRRLEQVRTEFVANVSHELRTPLTAIKGYLETLLDETPQQSATHRRFLEVANAHAERLGRLVDDLLNLSDIETGRVILKLTPVPLSDLVNEISAIFEQDASKKRLMLLNQIPSHLKVQADRDRVSQILMNLVDNAVKYTPEGGHVSFQAHVLPENMVEIEVKDTGIGIPSVDLPRITERFYRVDKTRSRELGGTGLGLAIVKHLVQLHSGSLHIESEAGKGTSIQFSLPTA